MAEIPAVVSPQYCSPQKVSLSVTKKVMDFNDGNFAFSDANGKTLFKLGEKKVFFGPDRTVLRDHADCPVVSLKKNAISLHDTYQVYRGVSNDELFTLKDKFLNDQKNEAYVIQLEGAPEPAFEVKGDFVRRNYQIIYNESIIVAEVAKKHSVSSFFTGKNKYGVHVKPNVDQAFIATVVTIMEAIYNEIKKESGNKSSSDEE